MKKDKISVEICAHTITSALAAQQGGADRIELCSAIEVGGLTPSPATIVEVRRLLKIDICVLIRPRSGDFMYSDIEFDIIKKDILFCRSNGINGVVVGILDKNKEIDIERMRELEQLARPMQIVCHRAFDQTPDGIIAMEQLIKLGYDRILTCGQATDVLAGKVKLKQLVEQAKGRIAIMPGNGVTVDNIQDVLNVSGAKDIHLTAKQLMISQMTGKAQGLFVKDAIDNNYYETSLDLVKKAVEKVGNL